MKRFLFISLSLLLFAGSAFGQDAAAIIKKAEEVRRGIESSQAEMTMTIVRPKWTRSMSMKSWSKGDDFALIMVTAPAAEEGSATLKREDEVWSYVPKIGRTVKLSRSMMSQNWMGSDLTNDDLVREVSLITDYDHRILKDTTIEERTCWKIELIPHEDVAVVWGKVNIFVDKKDYLQMRTESFDEDGYLVNVMQASQIKTVGGRTYTAKMEIIPVEEEGQKTILEYTSLKFDVPLDDNFFSVQNLKRIR
ncbi:MAG: outer membrane lipoprotein-sorting protein [Bacteroidota bacterium]